MTDLNLNSISLVDSESNSLTRIEKLLKIDVGPEECTMTINRLDQIYIKLSHYMSHTNSMLHECLLTLSEGIMEVVDDACEMDQDDEEVEDEEVEDEEVEDEDDDEDEDEDEGEEDEKEEEDRS